MNRNRPFLFVLFLIIVMLVSVPFAGTAAAQEETAVLSDQLTAEDLQAFNNGQAEIYEHNGRVTFVDGACTSDPVTGMEDAEKVVDSMTGLLGGDERTRFETWRTLTDGIGNTYYVFQQMYANTTVLGGAVKVITDPDGNMIGLISSIETELPDEVESEGISAEEAEQIVLRYTAENNLPEPALIDGLTAKMILPMLLSMDVETADERARFVWVVYSDNPQRSMRGTSELPYLAHYVTMDGEYLYSLETIIPGDTAGEAGFEASYVFEFMEPVDYTGYVDMYDGTEKEITVTVMRDRRTGMYYLGNIERKIAVADCWEFLYNNGRVVLASSPDNLEWDQVGLLSLYNYCKAWDYYHEIGWTGGDGLGTPILILNDMCDEQHIRIDNAAFMGNFLGWSLFGASLANDFSQALDVIAHEFTHCVTGTMMTYNSYINDFGAINEAMSDIQGEICDQMNNGPTDSAWIIGDGAGFPIRSMSDPNDYNQPGFTWDLYYAPPVSTPTTMNDHGGVHSNSSLLNNIAYRLIAEGGMTLEEARDFWFAVGCTMVPGTDYAQLTELLPWILKNQGMERYETDMQHAIDAVRLGIDEMPDFFDDDRAMVTLELPDNENYADDSWAMNIFAVDINGAIDKGKTLLTQIKDKNYSEFPPEVRDLFAKMDEEAEKPKEKQPGFLEILLEAIIEISMESESESEPTPEPEPEQPDPDMVLLTQWITEEFRPYFYSNITAAGPDGRTIRMVVRPGRTIPVLLHFTFQENSDVPDQGVLAIFINGKWYELPLKMPENDETDSENSPSKAMTDIIIRDTINNLIENLGNIHSADDVLDLFTVTIKGGGVTVIPNTGLEAITLPEPSEPSEQAPAELPEPGKKSRPKL